jgi:hypothetical protein
MSSRFNFFCWVNTKKPDMDYSYYLGPNWREELKNHKKPIPSIVHNHASFFDVWLMLSSYWLPAFIAKMETYKSIVGYQCTALQSLYIKRSIDGTKSDAIYTTEQIHARQKEIYKGRFKTLVVFPESFTTNNTRILKLKRGAFDSLLPIQPICAVYDGWPGRPVMAIMTIVQNAGLCIVGNLWQT